MNNITPMKDVEGKVLGYTVQSDTGEKEIVSVRRDVSGKIIGYDYQESHKNSSGIRGDSKDFGRGISFMGGIWFMLIPIVNIFYLISLHRYIKKAKANNMTISSIEESVYSFGKFYVKVTCIGMLALTLLISAIVILGYLLGEPVTWSDILSMLLDLVY